MHVVVIANQKGGSGKSTVATGLAAVLSELPDQEVLLVDVDPQQSAAWWMNRVGVESLPFDIMTTFEPDEIERLRTLESYGVVIIDTAGSVEDDDVLQAVLNVADYVVLPSEPTSLSLMPLLNMVRTQITPRHLPYRVLLSKVDARSGEVDRREAIAVLEDLKVPVFTTYIRQYKVIERLPGWGMTITGLVDQPDVSAKNAVMDMRMVGAELIAVLAAQPVRMFAGEPSTATVTATVTATGARN